MTLNIVFYAYRDWALEIFVGIIPKLDGHKITLIQNPQHAPSCNAYDISIFLGWSWIVDQKYLQTGLNLALHPSPLPKYRGGTPIQHQIMAGEKYSAVTFFKMTDQIDAGPIVWQRRFRIGESLAEILKMIVELGIEGVEFIIKNIDNLNYVAQDESQATFFRRRTPEMSEISLEELKSSSAQQLHDKIRSLQHPYPNAFLVASDGKRIYFTNSRIEKD